MFQNVWFVARPAILLLDTHDDHGPGDFSKRYRKSPTNVSAHSLVERPLVLRGHAPNGGRTFQHWTVAQLPCHRFDRFGMRRWGTGVQPLLSIGGWERGPVGPVHDLDDHRGRPGDATLAGQALGRGCRKQHESRSHAAVRSLVGILSTPGRIDAFQELSAIDSKHFQVFAAARHFGDAPLGSGRIVQLVSGHNHIGNIGGFLVHHPLALVCVGNPGGTGRPGCGTTLDARPIHQKDFGGGNLVQVANPGLFVGTQALWHPECSDSGRRHGHARGSGCAGGLGVVKSRWQQDIAAC